jgi:acyl carrier protein
MENQTKEFNLTETKQQIRNFIENNFMICREPESLDEDKSLLEQGLIDSTGVLELVAFLEKNFSVTIGDDEVTIQNLGSLNKMTKFIDDKLVTQTGIPNE